VCGQVRAGSERGVQQTATPAAVPRENAAEEPAALRVQACAAQCAVCLRRVRGGSNAA